MTARDIVSWSVFYFCWPFFFTHSQGGLREMSSQIQPWPQTHDQPLMKLEAPPLGFAGQRLDRTIQYQPEDASWPPHHLSPGVSGRPQCYRSSRFARGCCEDWPFYPPVGLIYYMEPVLGVSSCTLIAWEGVSDPHLDLSFLTVKWKYELGILL